MGGPCEPAAVQDRDGRKGGVSVPAVLDEGQGRRVGLKAVTVARRVFGQRLLSAYLIGSLAHEGFVAAVSDVDIALILAGADPGDAARVHRVSRLVLEQDRSVLASRLSIFWSTAEGLRSTRPDGRLPAIDWLDLIDSGKHVYGTALPVDTPRPHAGQLVEDTAEFAVSKWRHDPAWDRHLLDAVGLVREGRRAASKAALFPVRFLYTLTTGLAGGTHDAVAWYSTQARVTSRDLVAAAYDWRIRGFSDTSTAVRLLQEQLVPLYREFESSYRQQLLEQGLTDLADELTATIARLDRPVLTQSDS